jgi:hypothetical protein
MIIHREIGSSYHHKPIVQGWTTPLSVQRVDYSPVMVECKEEALVKEERQTEVILAVVPPPIFLW